MGHAQNYGEWDAAQSVQPQSLVASLEKLAFCVQRPALRQRGMLCTEANGVSLVMSSCIDWQCADVPGHCKMHPGLCRPVML